MASLTLKQAAGLGLVALALGVANLAAAQAPAAKPVDADLAGRQQAQQQSQPLNNQPVWKEVRSGLPQTTSLPGRETNVLIQSQGQTWRAARITASTALGALLAALVLALSGFYLWRGSIDLHGKASGRVIERFSPLQRLTHWSMGLTFTALAVTGLVLSFGKSVLLPLVGYTLYSWIATLAKNLHNFTGPVFSVALPVFVVVYVKDNLPRAHDAQWMAKFGGMLDRSGNTHVASGKFNAGEKGLFWSLVVAISFTLVVTGYILNFPNFNQTRETMQLANIVHLVAGLVGVALAALHIYMGTIGMKGAYEAMRYGYVDETWAQEHHEYWYHDVMAGRVPGRVAPGAPAVPYGGRA